MGDETSVEFSVNFSCRKCADKTREALQNVAEIHGFQVSLQEQKVLVTSSVPISELQRILESTGKKAVVTGVGKAAINNTNKDVQNSPGFLAAAVAAVGGTLGFSGADRPHVQGVVRFVQTDEDTCVIDGTLDGLEPHGSHGIAVFECGDLSNGCGSLGGHFNPRGMRHGSPEDIERHVGDLGNIQADKNGCASFRISDKCLKVWDVIGRSFGVSEHKDDFGRRNNPESQLTGNCGKVLSCGIIARSSGLFENNKKFCACDGVSIWDERDKPVAGQGRSSQL